MASLGLSLLVFDYRLQAGQTARHAWLMFRPVPQVHLLNQYNTRCAEDLVEYTFIMLAWDNDKIRFISTLSLVNLGFIGSNLWFFLISSNGLLDVGSWNRPYEV